MLARKAFAGRMHGSGRPGTELIALVSTFVLTDAIAADDEAATHTSVWELEWAPTPFPANDNQHRTSIRI